MTSSFGFPITLSVPYGDHSIERNLRKRHHDEYPVEYEHSEIHVIDTVDDVVCDVIGAKRIRLE